MKTIKAHEKIECAFDISYLLFAIAAGIYFLLIANHSLHTTILLLYGSAALVLAIGDAFHLVPRILYFLTNKNTFWKPIMGFGKMITSISMTIFYVLLFLVGQIQSESTFHNTFITISFYVLALLRIGICLLPNNRWKQNQEYGKWAIYRNLPFLFMGILTIYVYCQDPLIQQFPYLSIAILLSFILYLPVTLFAHKYPKLGMLMILKTIMYIWMLAMGFTII